MGYRIGLDIGIASVGWAVVDCDDEGRAKRIVDLGSRIFDVAEVPKTGAPLAEARRVARGSRRRVRRRTERLRRARELFLQKGVDINFSGEDIGVLRVKALDELISANDFARVLYSLCKNRGFKSNRKSDADDKEGGKLLKAANANNALMEEKGYRTIGELLLKEHSHIVQKADGTEYLHLDTRNKEGEYEKVVYRQALLDEIKVLFDVQRRFGNPLASEDVENQYVDIFASQRNFDEGPGKGSPYGGDYNVGRCTFNQDEERAPKASWANEWSTALQKLNNVRIKIGGCERCLTDEEYSKMLELMKTQVKVTYYQARKHLGLSDAEIFNITYPRISRFDKDGIEKTDKERQKEVYDFEKKMPISNMEKSKSIANALDAEHRTHDVVDSVAVVLSKAKSDDKRLEMFAKDETLKDILTDEEKDRLLSLTFDKFAMLGFTALYDIIPYLEQGLKYNEACKAAGYNHSQVECERTKLLNTEEIYNKVSEITSPVVKRAISQTLKVVNAIIRKYGSPIAVNVELARDMSQSREDRNKEAKENKERELASKRRQQELLDKTGIMPKGADLLKYRLYEEQCCQCVYCGKSIDLNLMLMDDNAYQVDHAMPYSRTFNDSLNNKVLVCTHCNQAKGNRLPYEYMDESQWTSYVARVNAVYANNYRKRDNLLATSIDEDKMKDRSLNDTRYICREVSNLIANYLVFDDSALKSKRVFTYNGRMTDFVRKRWGITKVREDGDFHHAVDAVCIACMSDSMLQTISKYYQHKELKYIGGNCYDADTDEYVGKADKFDRMPLPYENFRDELLWRTSDNVVEAKAFLSALGYTDEQLKDVKAPVASRMPKRKATGQIHDATIRSAKHYEESGYVVSKTPLTKLKLTKDCKEIEGYYDKDSDRLLYEKLLKMLQDAGGNAEKAFGKQVVYKPRSDGSDGNPVKKVKIQEKPTMGVLLDKVNGFAANGAMVRVDIFQKDGKYYGVPVYLIDAYKGILPNKAVVAHKPYEEWPEMDDTYEFLFSLYQNDLIYVEHKSGISMAKQRDVENSKMPDRLEFTKGFVYYIKFDIAGASATFEDMLNCYNTRLGIKTLQSIKKCQIDVLGNVSFVGKETRQPLNKR